MLTTEADRESCQLFRDTSQTMLMRPLHCDFRRAIDALPIHLNSLVAESEMEGFQFLRRLVTDWSDGTNTFSLDGEALFLAEHEGRLVGVAGLNIDPYAGSSHIGRVRRLYVSKRFRRHGVGSRLLAEIVAAAKNRFTRLQLFTRSADAVRFYVALGFVAREDIPQCTHVLDLD